MSDSHTTPASSPAPGAHPTELPAELDVLIVGAGFSGLYLVHRMRELGLTARAAQAAQIRHHTTLRAQLKPQNIMDVNQAAVREAFRAHGVQYLVHGHTHRPGIHHLSLDDKPATRIVLGDWYREEQVLWWDTEGYRLGSLAELGLGGEEG